MLLSLSCLSFRFLNEWVDMKPCISVELFLESVPLTHRFMFSWLEVLASRSWSLSALHHTLSTESFLFLCWLESWCTLHALHFQRILLVLLFSLHHHRLSWRMFSCLVYISSPFCFQESIKKVLFLTSVLTSHMSLSSKRLDSIPHLLSRSLLHTLSPFDQSSLLLDNVHVQQNDCFRSQDYVSQCLKMNARWFWILFSWERSLNRHCSSSSSLLMFLFLIVFVSLSFRETTVLFWERMQEKKREGVLWWCTASFRNERQSFISLLILDFVLQETF